MRKKYDFCLRAVNRIGLVALSAAGVHTVTPKQRDLMKRRMAGRNTHSMEERTSRK